MREAIAHHSADGLMIGKQALITFWHAVGMSQFGDWVEMAHPVFTNLVWRDDEFNFFKERQEHGAKGALASSSGGTPSGASTSRATPPPLCYTTEHRVFY